jgi:hypothetical protein
MGNEVCDGKKLEIILSTKMYVAILRLRSINQLEVGRPASIES